MSEQKTNLKCRCGEVSLQVIGEPIMSVECLCSDCQKAGKILQQRKQAPVILDENGATKFVMYRKDKIQLGSENEPLKSHYLEEDSKTCRVVTTCCNTPMFLDFSQGHWLSVYGLLWPKGELPPLELRTMTRSKPEGVTLSDDVPNPKTHTFTFYFKLLRAWVSMGFRTPKVEYSRESIDDV